MVPRVDRIECKYDEVGTYGDEAEICDARFGSLQIAMMALFFWGFHDLYWIINAIAPVLFDWDWVWFWRARLIWFSTL